ncbi:MAG: SufD family Fe-S cluster assembly protein [Alistipes sp.]|jgi:Fe-S cluster assembly protein SufD|nr:SufD family Fe-S cluster assembly protein [Alistipes sp.]
MSVLKYSEGEHSTEPLLLEAGQRQLSIVLEAGARLRLTAFVLGVGENAGLSLTVDLTGPGAAFHLHALALSSGEGRADISVKVNHISPHCVSRQLIKTIATDSATGSFSGLVHVAPGAQLTDASQRNQNLQLSDTAHILTNPGLEIYADDVKCSHGATIGRLDEEAVYYMRQRGIPEAEARRMQIHGFAGEIINHAHPGSLRDSIGAKVSALIDSF